MDIRNFEATNAAHLHNWSEPKESQNMIWPTNYTKIACSTAFTVFFAGNCFAPEMRAVGGETVQDYLQRHYIACFANLARFLLLPFKILIWMVFYRRIAHLDCILGFEIMNEPDHGLVGLKNFHKLNYDKELHLHLCPSPIQSMVLADGWTQSIDLYKRSWPHPTRKVGVRVVNKERKSIWTRKEGCVWRQHGVWRPIVRGVEMNVEILRPNYFTAHPVTGKLVDFNRDFLLPFAHKYSVAMRAAFQSPHHSPARTLSPPFLFFQSQPNEDAPFFTTQNQQQFGVGDFFIFSPHWYDLNLVFFKSFNGIFTHNVQELSRGSRDFIKNTFFWFNGTKLNYTRQLAHIANAGWEALGGGGVSLLKSLDSSASPPPSSATPATILSIPIIFGECGIPMDMNGHLGYTRNDYRLHVHVMDAIMSALERVQVTGIALWNFNPLNTVQLGDSWNGEDFSIFSQSIRERDSPTSASSSPEQSFYQKPALDFWFRGGRVLDAVVRPYACRVAGSIVKSRFSLATKVYTLHFRTPSLHVITSSPQPHLDATLINRTEIYVPLFHVSPNFEPLISVSDGKFEYFKEHQTLFYWHDTVGIHKLSIEFLPPLKAFRSNRAVLVSVSLCALIAASAILLANMLLLFS